MSNKQVIELSENYSVSMTKILTDMVDHDSVSGRRLLYSALSLVNPQDPVLEDEFYECREWAIKNNPVLTGMTDENIRENSSYVSVLAIERFYELHPEMLSFVIDYNSFVDLWYSDDEKAKSNQHQALNRIASQAHLMGIGRKDKLAKGHRSVTVSGSIPVFRSVKIIGFDRIIIKLNPDFMPYIVLLNQIFIGLGYSSFPVFYLVGQSTVSGMAMTTFALKFFRVGRSESQEYTFDVPTLRTLLGCENKYSVWKDFKKYMIDRGIDAVNNDAHSDLKIELAGTKKKGRVISHVTFRFTSASFNASKKITVEQKKYFQNKKKDTQNQRGLECVQQVTKKQKAAVAATPLNVREQHLTLMQKMTGYRPK